MKASRAMTTLLCILTVGCPALAVSQSSDERPVVVLLHGLARGASSMQRMATSLEKAGFRICNVEYPSREYSIARLAADYVVPRIAECDIDPNEPLNFVTHSLGGIVVRQLAATDAVRKFGRVVMLGPPNRGSEVVDVFGSWRLFDVVNGPAGRELGTSVTSVPRTLGPATFPVGIIAGKRSINWILSMIVPGRDDGKVSIENTKLEGMRDFVVVSASHPFLMRDRESIKHTIRFLSTGCFVRDDGESNAVELRHSISTERCPNS